MNGRVWIDRRLLNWEWWDDVNVTRLWIFILLNANWKENRWRGILIPRGSFPTSLDGLAEGTGLTKAQIRVALKKLETTGEITRKTTNRYQIITVEKYDFYQDADTVDSTQNSTQIADKSHANSTQIAPLEERKKERKKIPPIVPHEEECAIIIAYLNKKVGKNYKPNTKATQRLISGRLNDGFTVYDFLKVIDNQTDRWLHDEKMRDYLRPSTLFSPSKFEEYLNNAPSKAQQSKVIREENIKRAKANIDELTARIDYLRGKYNESSDRKTRFELHGKIAEYEAQKEQYEKYIARSG